MAGWVGPILPEKCTRPSAGGVNEVNVDLLVIFVLILCKMPQLLPNFPRATFAQNKFFALRTCFGAQAGCGDVTSLAIQKPSQKHQSPASTIGSRFRSPLFLSLIQNLKAVAMGVVAAVTFFWPNIIGPTQPHRVLGPPRSL